jgi:hypothetical protein
MSDQHIDEFGGKTECSVHHLPQPCAECWKPYGRAACLVLIALFLGLLLAPIGAYKIGREHGQRGADRWWQAHPLMMTCGLLPGAPGQILGSENGEPKWVYPKHNAPILGTLPMEAVWVNLGSCFTVDQHAYCKTVRSVRRIPLGTCTLGDMVAYIPKGKTRDDAIIFSCEPKAAVILNFK